MFESNGALENCFEGAFWRVLCGSSVRRRLMLDLDAGAGGGKGRVREVEVMVGVMSVRWWELFLRSAGTGVCARLSRQKAKARSRLGPAVVCSA